jgi:hypothetical protein
VDFLGPLLSAHSANIETVISAAPQEHRVLYRECLDKCVELNDVLTRSMASEKESSGSDRRNERRSAICRSSLFIKRRLDEVPGVTKKRLLSHLLQFLIGMAATKDMMPLLELSMLPDALCAGSIERSRIFLDLVQKAAPVCVPRLDITSSHFDTSQRVRVVGFYAAQVAYCVDMNRMVGMSDTALERTLETTWHWLVACGNALSSAAKGGEATAEVLCETCDSLKLFLDVAGATLLNFLGPRFKQFLVGPLRHILEGRSEGTARSLATVLDQLASANTLACVSDMYLLTPFSCFARLKKW